MSDQARPAGAIRRRPHTFTRRMKRFPWVVCAHCGLVLLRNKATEKAARLGCWVWVDEV